MGGLHHVEIYVSNLQHSSDFWGWFLSELGYEPFQEWEEGRSWSLDNTYLVFVQTKKKHLAIPYNRSMVGLNHLAFYAKSRDQVDDLTKKMRARGMTVLYEDRHPYAGGENHDAVYFEDPDRIKVELIAS